MIGLYFVAIRKREVAEKQYELLKHIAPEYPLTCLGQSLSEEIDRRVDNLCRVGRIWKARAEATAVATQQDTAESEG